MQIWPRAFSWPLRRLGWAPEIPPLIWHDLIWWISVLLLLLDVWTHMRGVRLREVFPELLWELMWDNSGPCLEQKRRRSRRKGGKRERGRWMVWVTVKTERWKKTQKWWREWGSNLCGPNPEHLRSPEVSVQHPLHLLFWICLSFVLPRHLTIVVLEVPAFWQLCLECCDGSLEGRVCMSGCVLSDGL